MVVLASQGTKLDVRGRTQALETTALTIGEFYEAQYEVQEGTRMTRAQAIEYVRAIRRRSLDYADAVLFQYAEIKEDSPQVITYQFKALKSTGSPFVFTLGFILSAIVIAAAGVALVGGAVIALKSLSTITTGITAPFQPTVTTTYVDPETGDEYGTYEEYAFAWTQRNPGVPVPEPGTREEREQNWVIMAIGLAVIIIVLLIVWYFYQRWGGLKLGKGGFKLGKK